MAESPERWLPHGQAKVWRALTDPELVSMWLPFEGFVAEIGHAFVAHGPDGRAECEVLDVVPPSQLVLAWRHPGGSTSTVHLRLVPDNGGTRILVTHEGLPAARRAPLLAMWATALSGPLHGALTPVVPTSPWVGSTGMWISLAAATAMIAGAVATSASWSPRRPDRFTPTVADEAAPSPQPVVSPAPVREPTAAPADGPPVRSGPPLPALPPRPKGLEALRVFEDELPTTLHPLYPQTAVDHRTHTLVFDRLFHRSAITSEVHSGLVAHHEAVDDLLKITLHPGLAFHDGHELTATDVCFSIDAALDPAHHSTLPFRARGDLLGCEVISHRKAVLRFRLPFADAAARADVPILPAHLFAGTLTPNDPFAEQPVGSGPYRAVKRHRSIDFVAAPSAQHDANVELISLEVGGDPFVQMKLRHAGEVDGLVDAHRATWPDLAAHDDTLLKAFDTRTVVYAAVHPDLSLAIRQAIDAALSRPELIRLTTGGGPMGPVPLSGPWLPSSPLSDRAVAVPEQARVDLAEPVSLVVGFDRALERHAIDLGNQVGNQLRVAGFDVRVVAGEAQAGSHDVWLGRHTYGVYEDPTALLSPTVLGGRSERVDAALQAYRDAPDADAAIDAGHELHRVVAEEKLVLPLFTESHQSAWTTDLRGATITPGTYWDAVDDWQWAPGR